MSQAPVAQGPEPPSLDIQNDGFARSDFQDVVDGIESQSSTGTSFRNSKAWELIFSQPRKIRDRPFIDTVTEPKLKLGLLTAFLQYTNASGPSWEVEEVQKFCNSTPEVPKALIWIDDRVSSEKSRKKAPKWVVPADLDEVSRQRIASSSLDGKCRRLTFVPELTPNIVESLVRTASWFEAQTLRPAVRQHIAGETSIRVFIPVCGYKTFRLELHLPYLQLKVSQSEQQTDEQGKKLWNNLRFLPIKPIQALESFKTETEQQQGHFSIYEAQTTVIISGANDGDWHGYALGNPGPKDAVAEEDDGNDEEEGPEVFFEEEEDFFATGGCEPVINPGDPIWDPRVYFLRTLQLRLAVVVQANEYLVQTLEAGVREWEIQEKEHLDADPDFEALQPADVQLRRSLKAIGNMKKLFQTLHVRFSKATTAWENFSSERGDILYFADLQSHDAKSALHKIEESFEKMSNLKLTLTQMQHTCEESSKVLALHLSHENLEMSRVLWRTNTHVVELTEAAAELAKKTQKAAEDTSRSTRVNVQLLVFTTAIVIALQYFCSDRAVFAFERNVRTFWVSISILVPSLGFLTVALHILDQFKAVFTERLQGKIEKLALPQVPPSKPSP